MGVARLNRAIADEDWRLRFPDADVIHASASHSDHVPLIVRLGGERGRDGPRLTPFRFQAAWMLHEDFRDFLQSNWQCEDGPVSSSLATLAHRLDQWNRDVFGNIF